MVPYCALEEAALNWGDRAAIISERYGTVSFENLLARTALLAKATRAAAEALGLKVFSAQPSDSVTGILFPAGVDDDFRKVLRTNYGVSVAGGQDDLKGKAFRVSHMGYVDPLDTIAMIAAVEYALVDCGADITVGTGVAAATQILKDWK